jgi:hypothetical protein
MMVRRVERDDRGVSASISAAATDAVMTWARTIGLPSLVADESRRGTVSYPTRMTAKGGERT